MKKFIFVIIVLLISCSKKMEDFPVEVSDSIKTAVNFVTDFQTSNNRLPSEFEFDDWIHAEKKRNPNFRSVSYIRFIRVGEATEVEIIFKHAQHYYVYSLSNKTMNFLHD